MQPIRLLSYALGRAAVFIPVLAACSADQPATFAGQMLPQAGDCDPASRAVLIKRGAYIQFTPEQGVLILNGQIGPAGDLTATLDTPGADRKPYHLRLTGTLSGHTITANYVTPRCRYTLKLDRAD